MLKLLQLDGYERRNVGALSGGQRQRVAMGRALAVDPLLLLLDEPMSNLDYKVRLDLRHELRALQKRVGITAIYVTHDREEALTLADRIAVIDGGRVLQYGTPEEVFHRPASPFVAGFMGADNAIELDRCRRRAAQRAHFRGDRARLAARARPDARRRSLRRHRRTGLVPRPRLALPRAPARGPVWVDDPEGRARGQPHPRHRAARCFADVPRETRRQHEDELLALSVAALLALPASGADHAQRGHGRRPEHGRLRQQLPRPALREAEPGRQRSRPSAPAPATPARRRSTRSSPRSRRPTSPHGTSTWR